MKIRLISFQMQNKHHMSHLFKKLSAALPLMFLCAICFGQPDSATGYYNMRTDGAPRILADSDTGIHYILDSAHIYIEAIDLHGKTIWKTDPWKDNKLPLYRISRPRIASFGIGKAYWTHNNREILITYNNTQTGYLDLRTGRFTFVMQL
jgi:hypothetical protein